MQGLMMLFLLATIVLLVMIIIAAIKKKAKKKLVISAISCFALFIVFASLSPKPKTETAKNKEVKETAAEAKKQNDQKKTDEKKPSEEQSKQEEKKNQQNKEDKKQEQQKTAVNNDKGTYENEIKPKIDAMMKEYDEIWNQEWKPAWTEISQNSSAIDKNALKEKMESISSKYSELSNKNTAFKDAEKLSDPALKEKMEKFRVEFGLATNYRGNAATAVNQGLKGVAPMNDRMNEALKSVKLSDQKIINAAIHLTEVETSLGISRK
ncbi:ribonuclease [Bacillus sp. XF8]|uniref:ribonuclease n=1 Tax=Bacillus sp. XF8 TaxID=2819289 RepID=UPI001AA03237|nr:ribonuclease [Bacillus sp. XF8]MBO1583336.1 ribonuclease [Bacillus sp. XF8]